MRITTLIIGLVLSIGLFIQSLTVAALGDAANTEDDGAGGALGILLALSWVVASALVIPFPLVSMIFFGLGGIIGIAGGSSTEFTDLTVWGVVSLVLALFSFFGWRGKKKQQAKETARDAQLSASLAAQQNMAQQLAWMQNQQAWDRYNAEQERTAQGGQQ